ncbi:SMP-30/gluconolactonase/LRE family protein [Sphingobium ummariense]|uniref:Gluconolactonase n=1 Tax=Sphingobium ummariense RL-3 TaxID=1346791 RepID=T0K838_9SPHN|nr:SMP-30/gluconolactonase/LRE family protein [Sphingobium ummariense]EQB32819.1 gluconolactonase [Sphingobium ummariense RL-3]
MLTRFRAVLLAASLGVACAPLMAQPPSTPPAAPSVERLDPALDAVIAPGTSIERVATGFSFTEGPLWHGGKLWFSDVTGDKMRSVTPQGEVQELIANSGGLPNPPQGASIGSNGMVPAPDGTVLMTQMGARRIVRVNKDLSIQPFLSDYQGKRLNSPNDLIYDQSGALWFTDPPFGLFNGMDKDPAKELPFNAVFRYADGKLEPVITDMTLPNGIGFSPDFKTLYVGNYGPEMYIRAYQVGPDGKLSAPREVIRFPPGSGRGGPDGLKVDSAGNIWMTGPGGIRIVTPQGKVLGQIKLPEVAANLAFAEDGHTVYITGSTSIYRLHSKVKGMLPLHVNAE